MIKCSENAARRSASVTHGMSAASNRMKHCHRSLPRSHKTIRHMKNHESPNPNPICQGTPSPRQPMRHWKATHGPRPRAKPELPQDLPYPPPQWPKGALGFCKDTQQCSCSGNKSPRGKFTATERKLNCFMHKEKLPKDTPTKTTCLPPVRSYNYCN